MPFVELFYAAEGVVGGYTLKEGLPVISLKVERRKGGVQLSCTPGAQRGAGAGLCLSAGRNHPLADAAGGMPPGAAGAGDLWRAQLVLYQRGCRRLLQLMCCRSWATGSTSWTPTGCC